MNPTAMKSLKATTPLVICSVKTCAAAAPPACVGRVGPIRRARRPSRRVVTLKDRHLMPSAQDAAGPAMYVSSRWPSAARCSTALPHAVVAVREHARDIGHGPVEHDGGALLRSDTDRGVGEQRGCQDHAVDDREESFQRRALGVCRALRVHDDQRESRRVRHFLRPSDDLAEEPIGHVGNDHREQAGPGGGRRPRDRLRAVSQLRRHCGGPGRRSRR